MQVGDMPDTIQPTEDNRTHWRWAEDGQVRVGSEAHKRLFCRMLLDTHDPYKPAIIEWPTLDDDALARLTGLPFWNVAVQTEGHAAARIERMAAQQTDPLIREAIALMAFEEQRHKDVLEAMISHYGIALEDEPPYEPPPNHEWYFMRTGYGECFDSFFAFGLFDLAKSSGFFPPELVETFEPVIQEEARHIVFFVNWAAYTQANKPIWSRPAFRFRRLHTLAASARARLDLARGRGDSNFMTEGRGAIDVDLTPRSFLDLCMSENDRRMARLDPRLLRPAIMPALVRCARPFVKRR